ncbi:hypothetical protein Pmani_015490 [Petrolisthes manimaculis]|uniref:Uncharacterized protein n=1 Tax=Petrolisthes manimaculis TaxID=1843537 RepID=A0AAE1PRV7_9EUCA|nr:hypothetical protein Pmani_015490 [Petrolisthes manimaculis]
MILLPHLSRQTLQQSDVDIPSQCDKLGSEKMDQATEDDSPPKRRPSDQGNTRGSVSEADQVNGKEEDDRDQKDDQVNGKEEDDKDQKADQVNGKEEDDRDQKDDEGFSDKEEGVSENGVMGVDDKIGYVQNPVIESRRERATESPVPVIIISEHEDQQVWGEDDENDKSIDQADSINEERGNQSDNDLISDEKEPSECSDKPDENQSRLESETSLKIEETKDVSEENVNQDSTLTTHEAEGNQELNGIHEDTTTTPPPSASDSKPAQLSEDDMLLVRQLPLVQGNNSEPTTRVRATTPERDAGGVVQAESDTLGSVEYNQESQDIMDGQHGLSGQDLEGAIGGEGTPLEPISEEDESDEDDAATPELHLFKSKLSSGITNLSTIGSDLRTEEPSHLQYGEEEPLESTTTKEKDETGNKSSSNDESSSDESSRKGRHHPHEDPTTTPTRSRRTGRITKTKKSPVFLSEAMRTFSNPISYLGGPNIEYEGQEEEQQGTRKRNDSVCSTTSLD